MRKGRLMEMRKFIDDKGIVTMEEICEHFSIAMNTARKDISELVKAGEIQKVYGGAKSMGEKENSEAKTYERRLAMNKSGKERIAAKAASFVNDGDIIYIDSGTTVSGMVDHLKDKNVTIFTPNIAVANNAMKYEKLCVFILGGRLNKESYSIEMAWDTEFPDNFNIDKAFLAATGYSIEGGAAQDTPWECKRKKFVVEHSTDTFIAADSSKIGKKALVKYADAGTIQNLITDKAVDERYAEFFKENGVKLFVV